MDGQPLSIEYRFQYLHESAQIHDRHPVADVLDHGQIMEMKIRESPIRSFKDRIR